MIHSILSAKACLEYILETEEEDFKLNPSDNHVYYHALTALLGDEVANDELEEALKEVNL